MHLGDEFFQKVSPQKRKGNCNDSQNAQVKRSVKQVDIEREAPKLFNTMEQDLHALKKVWLSFSRLGNLSSEQFESESRTLSRHVR